VGGLAVMRWLPGRKRPTIEEIEELVAAEVALAERDLQAVALPERAGLAERAELPERPQLSER
jgi:hypothetical protein